MWLLPEKKKGPMMISLQTGREVLDSQCNTPTLVSNEQDESITESVSSFKDPSVSGEAMNGLCIENNSKF